MLVSALNCTTPGMRTFPAASNLLITLITPCLFIFAGGFDLCVIAVGSGDGLNRILSHCVGLRTLLCTLYLPLPLLTRVTHAMNAFHCYAI